MTVVDEERPIPGRDWVAREIEKHRREMFRVCLWYLGNACDAEDTVGDAIEKLMKNPPKRPVRNPRAWLHEIAKNAARTRLSELAKLNEILDGQDHEPTTPAIDDHRVRRHELDVGEFQERLLAMVPKRRRDDVALYLELHRGDHTAKEQAAILGVSKAEIDKRHRRARPAVAKVAPVVALVTDPGEEPNHCDVPRNLARDVGDSPDLVREVEKHVGDCEKCGHRLDDPNGLAGVLLATTGVVLGGALFGRLLALSKAVKVTSGATVIAAAAVATVILVPRTPAPGPLPRPSTPAARPTLVPPVVTAGPITPPAPPAPPAPTPPPGPAATTPTTQAPPTSTTAPPPAPSGGGASAARPDVTRSSVTPRRIVAGEHGCRQEPHSSVVRITVTPGAKSARILLTVVGTTSPLPMSGSAGGTEWTGRVGPVPNEDAYGRLGVAVEVVGNNGARQVRSLGDIELCECRR